MTLKISMTQKRLHGIHSGKPILRPSWFIDSRKVIRYIFLSVQDMTMEIALQQDCPGCRAHPERRPHGSLSARAHAEVACR